MSSERNADSRSKAQKVLQKSEQKGRNEYTIAYDGMNPFRYAFLQSSSSFQTDISSHPSPATHNTTLCSLDCFALKPIYKGTPNLKCSYCASVYSTDYKGGLCLTCCIASVGVESVGLVTQGVARSK